MCGFATSNTLLPTTKSIPPAPWVKVVNRTRVARDVTVLYTSPAVALSHVFFALEFIQNKPTPPYTYGLGKEGTARFFILGRIFSGILAPQ